ELGLDAGRLPRGRIGRREAQVGERAGLERAGEQVAHGIRLQALPARVHDVAVAVDLERAFARVAPRTVVVEDEEALARQREVEDLAGEVDVALRDSLGDPGELNAGADRRAADAGTGDGEDVRDLGTRLLEARRARVRDVVPRDAEVRR